MSDRFYWPWNAEPDEDEESEDEEG